MAFILGIGLSGMIISSRGWRPEFLRSAPFALLVLAATAITLLVAGMTHWVEIYRQIRTGLAQTAMGYRLHQVVMAAFAIMLLGIPAGLIGAILPVCIRAQAPTSGLGDRVGRLLTWNTLGAVGGVLVTGFLIMPGLGLRGAFLFVAGLLATVAFIGSKFIGNKRFLVGSLTAGILITFVSLFGGEGWRHVLSSGVFRARETTILPGTMQRRQQHVKLLFYEDAPDATVTVEEGDGIGSPADVGLRINGKPDASANGDLSSQLLVAQLPIFAKPGSKDIFVVGFGSGISAGSLLNHPIQRLDVAENCEPVLRAGRFFERWNNGILKDPRVTIWTEDARTVLKLTKHHYDILISQPSNPWMAGVGSVFSREYYQLAASRLKPGGIMAQWFHIYEMHDGIVNLVLRTFGGVFPFIEIWDVSGGDIVILGSLSPWESSVQQFQRVFENEKARRDLANIGVTSPTHLWARQFASQDTARYIPGDGPTQSDEFPVLEYEAPKAFFIGANAQMLNRFDERTWQQGLANSLKRSALTNLSLADLFGVFRRGTINPDLRGFLETQSLNHPDTVITQSAPIIFNHARARNSPGLYLNDRIINTQVDPTLLATQLLDQCATNPAPSARAEIGLELVKAALAVGRIDLAGILIDLASDLDPGNSEPAYLRRILAARPTNLKSRRP